MGGFYCELRLVVVVASLSAGVEGEGLCDASDVCSEDENKQLKMLVAETMLENAALEEWQEG